MTDNERLAELIFPNIHTTIEDLEKRYPKRELPEGAIVDRFAPSPTGFLHSGSLFTAMICHKFAKQTNGVFMLRLEDTDSKREVEGSGQELIDQLANFNIVPTEGYYGTYEKGNYGPYKQSDRHTDAFTFCHCAGQYRVRQLRARRRRQQRSEHNQADQHRDRPDQSTSVLHRSLLLHFGLVYMSMPRSAGSIGSRFTSRSIQRNP